MQGNQSQRIYRPDDQIRIKLTFERPIEKFAAVRLVLGGPMHGEKRSEIELGFEAPSYSGDNQYIVRGYIPSDVEPGRYRPLAVYVERDGEFEKALDPSPVGDCSIEVGTPRERTAASPHAN